MTTAVRLAAPSGRSGWLLASLGVLAAALTLAVGLAVLAPDGQAAGSGSATPPDHDLDRLALRLVEGDAPPERRPVIA